MHLASDADLSVFHSSVLHAHRPLKTCNEPRTIDRSPGANRPRPLQIFSRVSFSRFVVLACLVFHASFISPLIYPNRNPPPHPSNILRRRSTKKSYPSRLSVFTHFLFFFLSHIIKVPSRRGNFLPSFHLHRYAKYACTYIYNAAARKIELRE